MFGRIQTDDGHLGWQPKKNMAYVSISALPIAGEYIQTWFAASMPNFAPNNDLLFPESLQEYSAMNKVLSDGAVQK